MLQVFIRLWEKRESIDGSVDLDAGKTLEVQMASGGGFAARITKK